MRVTTWITKEKDKNRQTQKFVMSSFYVPNVLYIIGFA